MDAAARRLYRARHPVLVLALADIVGELLLGFTASVLPATPLLRPSAPMAAGLDIKFLAPSTPLSLHLRHAARLGIPGRGPGAGLLRRRGVSLSPW